MQALSNKNPQARAEAALFLSRCLSVTRKAPTKDEVKSLTNALLKVSLLIRRVHRPYRSIYDLANIDGRFGVYFLRGFKLGLGC